VPCTYARLMPCTFWSARHLS